LENANRETFEVLNRTFAKDEFIAWKKGRKIEKTDAKSFEICDDGYSVFPLGFCKDKNNVFYFDEYEEKINIVKNALPKTFISLNDGYFRFDEKAVFYKIKELNEASPKTWKIIKNGYLYSKGKFIYYGNRI
jgi:hypothetical protein